MTLLTTFLLVSDDEVFLLLRITPLLIPISSFTRQADIFYLSSLLFSYPDYEYTFLLAKSPRHCQHSSDCLIFLYMFMLKLVKESPKESLCPFSLFNLLQSELLLFFFIKKIFLLLFNYSCMPFLHRMEFYAAERKKELIPFAIAWMELESIMLSEISQMVSYFSFKCRSCHG